MTDKDPYPKTWFEMYNEERVKREALEVDKEILRHNVRDIDDDYNKLKDENQKLREHLEVSKHSQNILSQQVVELKERCKRQDELLNPVLEHHIDIHGMEEQISEWRDKAEKAEAELGATRSELKATQNLFNGVREALKQNKDRLAKAQDVVIELEQAQRASFDCGVYPPIVARLKKALGGDEK